MLEAPLREGAQLCFASPSSDRDPAGSTPRRISSSRVRSRMCGCTYWTGSPAPTDSCATGSRPTTRRSSHCRTTSAWCWSTSGCDFLGNIEVGAHGLDPGRLLELYHAVVYCVGAARDRRLGIPGEDLPGSHSATDFVSWYSAHPDAAGDGFVLGARSAVVIGVGNVAVDVARILARGADELRPTDMPEARARRAVAEPGARCAHGGPARPVAGQVHHQGAAGARLAALGRRGRRTGGPRSRPGVRGRLTRPR